MAIGPAINEEGTATNVTPVSGLTNQFARRRYANVVTTQNQSLGLRYTAAPSTLLFRGGGVGAGGFYFATKFIIGLNPNNQIRIFAGLSSSTNAIVVADSGSIPIETVGFMHNIGDNGTTMRIVSRGSGAADTDVTFTCPNIASGQGFLAELMCWENESTQHLILWDLNTRTRVIHATNGRPTNTVGVFPQIQMSNGTANTTANTVAIDIVHFYADTGNEWA